MATALLPAPLPALLPPMVPSAPAARAALRMAVAGALAVHIAAAVLVAHAGVPELPLPTMGRKRGAMTVVAQRGVAAPATIPAAAPAAPLAPVHRVKIPSASPGPVAAAKPLSPTPPGAQFASVFAPVVQTPFGRSSWGRSPPRPPPPPDMLVAQQTRERAAWRLASELRVRLAALAENLRQSGQVLACDVSVDVANALAQVDCTEASDRALPWSYLQGLVVAGNVADSPSRQCFRIADQRFSDGSCPAYSPSTP